MTNNLYRRAAALLRVVAIAWSLGFAWPGLATGSVLTFDIFDPLFVDPDPPAFNAEGVPESRPFFEGYLSGYGSNVSGFTGMHTNGTTTFGYDQGSEGDTLNVVAAFGPYSFLTGGPEIFRGGFGDLTRVLYQGSVNNGSGGTDYNILEIALIADPEWDVVLYGFDLAGFNQDDHVINSVTVYNGIPFPFIFPTNQIFVDTGGGAGVNVEGDSGHTEFDFESSAPTALNPAGGPLQANVIWIRIDANNLGSVSDSIGIDNIRFGQVRRDVPVEDPVDLADIDGAFQAGEAPEAASLVVWLVGGGAALTWTGTRRRWFR